MKKAAKKRIEAEADELNILSKITELVVAPMEMDMREVALGGDSGVAIAVAGVAKEYSKKSAKNMTEAEADALKILSKTTEAAEVPMAK